MSVRILRLKEVQRMTGLSRSTIYAEIAKGKFPKQVKLMADGAFFSQLMQLQEPYTDGHEGVWLTEPPELETSLRAYWQEEYQVHIHVNGDKGVAVVLDLIEKMQTEFPRVNHRTTLHHLGYSTPDQAKKMAQLGVLVSANPYYLYSLGEQYAKRGLGEERARDIFLGSGLTDQGVRVSLHSDFTMAPVQPLLLMEVAVTRRLPKGEVFSPELALDRLQGLRAITSEAAYAIGLEESVGSIEVGKKADFTVLAENPMTVDADRLADITILATVFEGKVFRLN